MSALILNRNIKELKLNMHKKWNRPYVKLSTCKNLIVKKLNYNYSKWALYYN